MERLRTITDEKLQEILTAHREWRGSNGKKGRRADLSNADLGKRILENVNLAWADLSWTNLSEANLIKADLSGADLGEADLSGADLSRANLSEANLSRSNLSRANFIEANLSRANFIEANLSEANLSEANLSGAIGWTSLTNISSVQAALERAMARVSELEKINAEADNKKVQKELAEAKKRAAQLQAQLNNAETRAKAAEKKLTGNVDKAIVALRNSAEETKDAIGRNKHLTKYCFRSGLACFVSVFVWAFLRLFSNNVLPVDIPAPAEVTDWWRLFTYSLPVLVLLTAGTALLRHHAAITRQNAALLTQQYAVEKGAGLLQAAMHLSPNKTIDDDVIQDTFKSIRSEILRHGHAAEAMQDDDANDKTRLDRVISKLK